MVDLTPRDNKEYMRIPDLIDLLKNEPDDLYRVFLLNGKMYQAIKSKGEVTILVNSNGGVFKQVDKLFDTFIVEEWVEVDRLKDINTFLLIAQVKGWI